MSKFIKNKLIEIDFICRALFENSMDAVFITATDGQIFAANPAACQLFGYTEEEIIKPGRNGILDLTDERIPGLHKDRELNGKITGESRFKRKDGSIFPAVFTSTVIRDSDSKDRTIIIIRDKTYLKVAEESIRKSEDKFRMLVNLSPSGIYMTDEDGKCTFVNEAWCKMAGMDPEEAYGDGWINAIHPNDRIHVFNLWEIYVNSGKEWNWSYRFIDKKGNIRWIYGLSKPVLNKDGEIIGYLGNNTDITERKKLENALNQSESRFRKMAECSLTGIYIVVENRLKYVNSSLAKIFGYTQKELTGEDLMKVVYPSDREMVAENIRRRISGEIGSLRYEFRGLCKNGASKYILAIGEAIELDGKRSIFGNILDITDQKLAEENLKQSEEKYRLLSEQSGVGVGLYSKEGIILYFNIRALKNLGGKLEDYVGRSLMDVFGRKDGNKYLKRVKEEIRLRNNLFFEDYIESPTGKYWFLTRHSTFINSKGEVIGVQAVSHDISKSKHMESQLIKTTTELRELARHLVEVREVERTAIARDLHDDLGQKLTALNMDLSWLKARIGVQSYNVENKLKQMDQMINNTIESVQKISYGLRPSILDDLGLIPAIEWQLSGFHKSSGISCNFTCSPKDISFDTNISLVVFRIIQEALTNIARHSGATKVSIKISRANGILGILIKDNGSGISLEKIGSSKSYGLIGMRERVRVVGGDITITGKNNEGTRVSVRIPAG